MSGNVAFFPGVPRCELCESAPVRANFEGLWLCEACFDQVRSTPAPVQTPTPAQHDERFGPSLLEMVDRLLKASHD